MTFRDELRKVRERLFNEEPREGTKLVITGPRPDPEREPSHRAARIADRERGEERGDFFD